MPTETTEKKFRIPLQVAYADTDQMGYVHHSNYVKYMEHARWEAFRKTGLAYKEIEARGIIMPVISMNMQYLKPIVYDELVTIDVGFSMVRPAALEVDYLIFNENNTLVHRASTRLAFLKKSTKSPCVMPDFIKEKIAPKLLKNTR
jgi:acyl-CoA thioester hydrolase